MQEMCAEDPVKADQCQNFLDTCLLDQALEEACIAGAWLICTDLFDDNPDPEDVCRSGYCDGDPVAAEVCDEFMMQCELGESDEALCAVGGWYICQTEVEVPPETDELDACTGDVCEEDSARQQQCGIFLASCLDGVENPEHCVAGAWLFCTDLFD
jgi:hypothetical protein